MALSRLSRVGVQLTDSVLSSFPLLFPLLLLSIVVYCCLFFVTWYCYYFVRICATVPACCCLLPAPTHARCSVVYISAQPCAVPCHKPGGGRPALTASAVSVNRLVSSRLFIGQGLILVKYWQHELWNTTGDVVLWLPFLADILAF